MAGEHANRSPSWRIQLLAIMFNKIPIDAEVDARFYMILDNYPSFWVRTRHVSFRTSKEHVKLFESCIERDQSLKQIITKRK